MNKPKKKPVTEIRTKNRKKNTKQIQFIIWFYNKKCCDVD